MEKPLIAGYWPQRWLPDGRFLGVAPALMNRGRLCLCLDEGDDLEQFWCFGSYADAVAAFEAFRPGHAPQRWTRHWPSDRRRPAADPAREYGRGEMDPALLREHP